MCTTRVRVRAVAADGCRDILLCVRARRRRDEVVVAAIAGTHGSRHRSGMVCEQSSRAARQPFHDLSNEGVPTSRSIRIALGALVDGRFPAVNGSHTVQHGGVDGRHRALRLLHGFLWARRGLGVLGWVATVMRCR